MKTSEYQPVILVADDQADVVSALRLLMKGEGFQTESASSPAGVLAYDWSRLTPPRSLHIRVYCAWPGASFWVSLVRV